MGDFLGDVNEGGFLFFENVNKWNKVKLADTMAVVYDLINAMYSTLQMPSGRRRSLFLLE